MAQLQGGPGCLGPEPRRSTGLCGFAINCALRAKGHETELEVECNCGRPIVYAGTEAARGVEEALLLWTRSGARQVHGVAFAYGLLRVLCWGLLLLARRYHNLFSREKRDAGGESLLSATLSAPYPQYLQSTTED